MDVDVEQVARAVGEQVTRAVEERLQRQVDTFVVDLQKTFETLQRPVEQILQCQRELHQVQQLEQQPLWRRNQQSGEEEQSGPVRNAGGWPEGEQPERLPAPKHEGHPSRTASAQQPEHSPGPQTLKPAPKDEGYQSRTVPAEQPEHSPGPQTLKPAPKDEGYQSRTVPAEQPEHSPGPQTLKLAPKREEDPSHTSSAEQQSDPVHNAGGLLEEKQPECSPIYPLMSAPKCEEYPSQTDADQTDLYKTVSGKGSSEDIRDTSLCLPGSKQTDQISDSVGVNLSNKDGERSKSSTFGGLPQSVAAGHAQCVRNQAMPHTVIDPKLQGTSRTTREDHQFDHRPRPNHKEDSSERQVDDQSTNPKDLR